MGGVSPRGGGYEMLTQQGLEPLGVKLLCVVERSVVLYVHVGKSISQQNGGRCMLVKLYLSFLIERTTNI